MATVNYNFKGEVLLVTGASSGIGRLVSQLFAENGGSVICVGRHPRRTTETVEFINKNLKGVAVPIIGDVADPSTFDSAIEAANTLGGLNFAFNCAGAEGPLTPIHDTSQPSFIEMMNTKLLGCFLGMKAQIAAMRASGGVIVNMVGTFGHIGYPYMGAYCAAAHGVLGLTRTAALEEGINNIRVNAVCPGAVDTELLVRMMGGDRDAGLAIGDSTALGRVATAEDVAGAVMYLLSDAASYVSGSSIMLDGGT